MLYELDNKAYNHAGSLYAHLVNLGLMEASFITPSLLIEHFGDVKLSLTIKNAFSVR